MNPRRQQVHEDKFRRINEACATDEYYAKALERLLLEYFCFIEVEPKHLDEQIRERLSIVPAPRGWRRKALAVLAKTIFTPFNRQTLEENTHSYNQGFTAGFFRNLHNALEASESSGEKDILPGALAEHQPMYEQLKTEAHKIESQVNDASACPSDVPPLDREELLRGYQKGEHAIFSMGTKLAKDRSNIKFYLFMLMLGDYIELFDTVDELREYAQLAMGPDFSTEPESFNKACYRVNFRGAKHLRSRRSKRMVDKAQVPVQ